MENFEIRTDLALETREKFEEDNVEIKGVILEEIEDKEKEILITKVVIETENGAKAMGKPRGTYITLEAPNMSSPDEDYHREVSEVVSKYIRMLMPKDLAEKSILVVGLGNREITPDSLGPCTVDNLLITRHVIKEYGKYAMGEEKVNLVSSIVPGVMANTGMESLEIIKGIVKETEPDVVVAIDALAARNTKRLNRTIQISDTGINPGAGVGNNRSGINEESLGVPVISIGVPTVVEAATIVSDTFKNLVDSVSKSEKLKPLYQGLDNLDDMEKYQLIGEMLSPNLKGMFVTPKDIDDTVKRLAFTISEALNMTFKYKRHN